MQLNELHYLYLITNETRGLQYVGVSYNPKNRIKVHLNGTGNRLISEHKNDLFTFKILCAGTYSYIYSLEAKCVEKYNTISPNGYNLKPGGLLGGTSNRAGERNTSAIVSELQVLEIRNKYNLGITQIKLAEEYLVSREAISAIVRGKSWSHVGGPLEIKKSHKKLSQENIDEIIRLRKTTKLSFEKIGKIVGASTATCHKYAGGIGCENITNS